MKTEYNNRVPDSWKVRVTPELSERIQEICFNKDITWLNDSKEIKHLDANWLFCRSGRLTFESEGVYVNNDVEEISAFAFITTNGKLKWLPKHGEKCLVSGDSSHCNDFSDVEWEVDEFIEYNISYGCSNPIICKYQDYKFVKPIPEGIDFAEFLQEQCSLKEFKENCKIQNQRWEDIYDYYENMTHLSEKDPKQWIIDAFNWKYSSYFEISEITIIHDEWLQRIENEQSITFDKNNLFCEGN